MCPCCDKLEEECICKPDCPGCDCSGDADRTADTIMYTTPSSQIW